MELSSFPAQLSFITDLFSNTRLRQDFIATIVNKLQVWTGCQCVGIRIVNPDAYMPYEAYVGFSQEFWEHENWLSLREHQCGCIRVVNNKTLPEDQPILTENGSILSNDLQAFDESLCPADATLYRGKCIECGFGSLALVPIRQQDTVIGLIHLADKRTNLLPPALIQSLEALTAPIAVVIDRFNTENLLGENRKLLSQAQKIAHIGSWKLDIATNRLAWSDEVYRIFGCEPQEFDATCEDFLGFIHPDDRAAVEEAYTSSLREGRDNYEIEHRIVRRISDDVRYVHEHCVHERDAAGAIVQSIGTVQDITERKQVEKELLESEARYRSLFEAANVGKSVTLTSGALQANRTFCDMLGYSPEELRGKTWQELTHPEDIGSLNELLTQMLEGKKDAVRFEKRYQHKNGSYLWGDVSATLLRDGHGNPQYFITTVVSITERKQAQLALEQKNQEMEQFVYIISHDLKSPLVTVKTFVNILRQDLQAGDQPQINEDLNYIDKAADKMQQLLDALLKYSRIGTIDAPAQTLPVDQQVLNCLATLAGILQQHQVQVSTSDLPHQLHGNPMHFGQIWQNLVENAVKYRGDQAQPQIEIGATQEGQDVVFYVRDNGMGIEPEHNKRIFILFSQLNPDSDGSGLGLALVKKIVSIYHGRIWVDSAGEGQGSCFKFTLPGALKRHEVTE